MNITEEVKIPGYRILFFMENPELYEAMREYWEMDRDNCEVFAASLFYELGRVHGVREERARKRGKTV